MRRVPRESKLQLTQPMAVENAPERWVMNARTTHQPKGVHIHRPDFVTIVLPCQCVECVKKDHPHLETGPAVPTHEEFDALRGDDLVGLYIPANAIARCAECGNPIRLDADEVLDDGGSEGNYELLHDSCVRRSKLRI